MNACLKGIFYSSFLFLSCSMSNHCRSHRPKSQSSRNQLDKSTAIAQDAHWHTYTKGILSTFGIEQFQWQWTLAPRSRGRLRTSANWKSARARSGRCAGSATCPPRKDSIQLWTVGWNPSETELKRHHRRCFMHNNRVHAHIDHFHGLWCNFFSLGDFGPKQKFTPNKNVPLFLFLLFVSNKETKKQKQRNKETKPG